MQLRQVARGEAPWWHTLNPLTRDQLALPDFRRFPARETRKVDVVVVGAGLAGLAAAASAAERGLSVLVLEAREHLGAGASGQNAGILSAGINMGLTELAEDSPHRSLWYGTASMLDDILVEAQRPGSLLEAAQTGSVSLAISDTAAHRLDREAQARRSIGLRAEVVSRRELDGILQGRINLRGVKGGLWLPDEGRIQPLSLLAHLVYKVKSKHGVIMGGVRVEKFREVVGTRGRVAPHWEICLDGDMTVEALALIRAIGPTVKPNSRIYALSYVCDMPENFPNFWDAAPYWYYDYRSGDGLVTVSGGRYGNASNDDCDEKYFQKMSKATCHWLPELNDQEPQFKWAVDLKVSKKLVPALRPLTRVSKSSAVGFAIEGLGALGVLPGLVLGRRAGQEVSSALRRGAGFQPAS